MSLETPSRESLSAVLDRITILAMDERDWTTRRIGDHSTYRDRRSTEAPARVTISRRGGDVLVEAGAADCGEPGQGARPLADEGLDEEFMRFVEARSVARKGDSDSGA